MKVSRKISPGISLEGMMLKLKLQYFANYLADSKRKLRETGYKYYITKLLTGFPGGGKESACQRRRQKRHRFNPWVGKIPWSRKWQPTPVFLPRKFHGQKRLVGYNSWGHKELDM